MYIPPRSVIFTQGCCPEIYCSIVYIPPRSIIFTQASIVPVQNAFLYIIPVTIILTQSCITIIQFAFFHIIPCAIYLCKTINTRVIFRIIISRYKHCLVAINCFSTWCNFVKICKLFCPICRFIYDYTCYSYSIVAVIKHISAMSLSRILFIIFPKSIIN